MELKIQYFWSLHEIITLQFNKVQKRIKETQWGDIGIKSSHHDIIIKGLKNVNLESISTRKEDFAESLSEFVKEFGVQQFLLGVYWIEKGKLAENEFRCHYSEYTKVLSEIKTENNLTKPL